MKPPLHTVRCECGGTRCLNYLFVHQAETADYVVKLRLTDTESQSAPHLVLTRWQALALAAVLAREAGDLLAASHLSGAALQAGAPRGALELRLPTREEQHHEGS